MTGKIELIKGGSRVSAKAAIVAVFTAFVLVLSSFGTAFAANEDTVTSLELDPTSLSVKVDETGTITAIAKDTNGDAVSDAVITWKSSDTEIATVTGGVVTGVKAGSATI